MSSPRSMTAEEAAAGHRACPFCGGLPLVDHDPDTESKYPRPTWAIVCRSCAAAGPWSKAGLASAWRGWDGLPSTKVNLDRLLAEHDIQYDGEHIRITRTNKRTVELTWSEMQALKNWAAASDIEFYELFPREADLVDEIPARHLWRCEGLSRLGRR